MAELSIKIVNEAGITLCEAGGTDFVDIVYSHPYELGDKIFVSSNEKPIYLKLQLDDSVGETILYMKDDMEYQVPFGERKANLSSKAFDGKIHYLFVERASEELVQMYRNLACNLYDVSGEATCYPHASANIETRNESVFAARNAIDGVRANLFHGVWPYTSWGINRRDDAEFRLDFGRSIMTDKIVLYTRADFPHDNWWEQATITFSDGECLCCKLEKSRFGQVISFSPKKIEWLRLHDLIKADDPSPFPALTQIEVYGREVL